MKLRTETLEGRPHYVVPCVLIRQGTWTGSQGPVFYSEDVLRASARAWNGRPVVVHHPSMNGGFSGQPEIFDRQRVGVVFKAQVEDGKLKGEVWLDKARLEKLAPSVAYALRHDEPVNVSTGLGAGTDGTTTPDGAVIAMHLEPDHLAILPEQRGACSVEDGAGLLMNATVAEIPLTMAAL